MQICYFIYFLTKKNHGMIFSWVSTNKPNSLQEKKIRLQF